MLNDPDMLVLTVCPQASGQSYPSLGMQPHPMGRDASFQTDSDFLARCRLKSVNQAIIEFVLSVNKKSVTPHVSKPASILQYLNRVKALARSRSSVRHPRRICALTSLLENLPSHTDEVQTPACLARRL